MAKVTIICIGRLLWKPVGFLAFFVALPVGEDIQKYHFVNMDIYKQRMRWEYHRVMDVLYCCLYQPDFSTRVINQIGDIMDELYCCLYQPGYLFYGEDSKQQYMVNMIVYIVYITTTPRRHWTHG